MLPNPLHPAVVHLPIALALLAPLFALGALVVISRGARARPVWLLVVALQAMLVLGALAALETGEDEEEVVEEVVPESALKAHEEAAERFRTLAIVALAISALGLVEGRAGMIGRVLGTVATVAVLAAGVQVGHYGGQLVFRHGAASAYVTGAAAGDTAAAGEEDRGRNRRGRDDKDDD